MTLSIRSEILSLRIEPERRQRPLSARPIRGAVYALLLPAAMVLSVPSLAAVQHELPAPSLSVSFFASAGASSIGPSESESIVWSPSGTTVAAGQTYIKEYAGRFRQSYFFSDPAAGFGASGSSNLDYRASFGARASFGELGVRASLSQSGNGSVVENGIEGIALGSSYASTSIAAVDTFVVTSATLPVGAPASVDFGVSLSGQLYGSDFRSGFAYTSAALTLKREVMVYRGSAPEPVLHQTRDNGWGVGEFEQPSQLEVNDELPWSLPLQVGDEVVLRLSLAVGVTSTSNGSSDFATGGRAESMDSLHSFLVPQDADRVQLVFASGHNYLPPVPEHDIWMLMSLGLVSLAVRARRNSAMRPPGCRLPSPIESGLCDTHPLPVWWNRSRGSFHFAAMLPKRHTCAHRIADDGSSVSGRYSISR